MKSKILHMQYYTGGRYWSTWVQFYVVVCCFIFLLRHSYSRIMYSDCALTSAGV